MLFKHVHCQNCDVAFKRNDFAQKTIKWLNQSNIKIIEIDKMIKFNNLEVSDIFTTGYKKKINKF